MRRLREKAQPNKGTQPLLQIKTVTKRGKEKLKISLTRPAVQPQRCPSTRAAAPGRSGKRDRTKIIKLRLIANRNRAPPATHHRCRFPFTVLAAASAAQALSSSSSLPSTAAQRQRIACSHQHSAHLTYFCSSTKISHSQQQQGTTITNLIITCKTRPEIPFFPLQKAYHIWVAVEHWKQKDRDIFSQHHKQ